jgi:hypothetical protein
LAIDYVIDLACAPKAALSTEGILECIKGRARAEAIIQLFRDEGDNRPVSEIGFEFSRTAADGTQETGVAMVQHLLDDAEALDPLAHHCVGCPANINDTVEGKAYGCFGFIQYPLSARAEAWLINRLPGPEEPLVWLLLRQGIEQLGYDGKAVEPLRQDDVYFEERRVLARDFHEFRVTANQVFEMLFLLGHIQPAHAGVLLLFFNAISRDIEAQQIMQIMNAPEEITPKPPFLLQAETGDDQTISELKAFFKALYTAWTLQVKLLLDV